MPYNTTAIPPRKEATGQAQLPLARVKKIIALDAEISQCSTHAAFVMTLAAEMFIQYLAEQGNRVAKEAKKPRRNIQYADISNAIHRLPQTEFLTDVVPRTVPYKKIVERKAKEAKDAAQAALENGAAAAAAAANGTNGTSGEAAAEAGEDAEKAEDPNAQIEREIRAQSEKAPVEPVEKTNGHREDKDGDVEMAE